MFDMKTLWNEIRDNAEYASYMKLGRDITEVLINQIADRLPGVTGTIIASYLKTPIGRLIVVQLAHSLVKSNFADKLRDKTTIRKALSAACMAAYEDVVNLVDIKGMLTGLVADSRVQSLLSEAKLLGGDDEEEVEVPKKKSK